MHTPLRHLLVAAVATGALAACSSNNSPATGNAAASDRPGTATSQTAAGTDGTEPEATELPIAAEAQLLADVLDAAEPFELTTRDLPKPPAAFTKRDVAAFAESAIDVINRSVEPGLHKYTPAAAAQAALADLEPSTILAYKNWFRRDAGSLAQYNVASLVRGKQVGAPRVYKAVWDVGQGQRQMSDGTNAPHMWLALEAVIRVDYEVDGKLYPTLVERALWLEGFRPSSLDSGWWPGIRAVSLYAGIDTCGSPTGPHQPRVGKPKAWKGEAKAVRWLLNRPEKRVVDYPQPTPESVAKDRRDRTGC